jgi:hypothetical protein
MSDEGSGVVIARQLPQPWADGNNTSYPIRGGRYREAYSVSVYPDFKASADEGSFFTGTNPTFGTAVAGPNAAAFSATSAILSLLNRAGATGVRTYLTYLRLVLVTIPTAGTSLECAVTLDSIPRGSAGTPITLATVNLDSATPGPATTALYNPTVAAASNGARNIARAKVKAATPVTGDEYLLIFGSVEMAGALIASATTAGRYLVPMPPVIIGPGNTQSALVHLWSPGSSAAPTFEFELGVIER